MSLVRQITSLEGGRGRNLESPASQCPSHPTLSLSPVLHFTGPVFRVTLQMSRIVLSVCPNIAGCRPFKGDVGLFTTAPGSTGPDCFIPRCLTVSQTSSDGSNYLSIFQNWTCLLIISDICLHCPKCIGYVSSLNSNSYYVVSSYHFLSMEIN